MLNKRKDQILKDSHCESCGAKVIKYHCEECNTPFYITNHKNECDRQGDGNVGCVCDYYYESYKYDD